MKNPTQAQTLAIDKSLSSQFETAGASRNERFWAACPITQRQAKSVAGILFAKGVFSMGEDDVAGEACEWALAHPDLNAANIIANIIQSRKPGHKNATSVICTKSTNVDLDGPDTIAIQIAAPEELTAASMDEWRAVEVAQIDIDNLRKKIMETMGVGDRRARQIIQKATIEIEGKVQGRLFGFDFEAAE